MGIFTRRNWAPEGFRQRELADEWQPDGCGVVGAGDAVAEHQTGESYSVRLRHGGMPCAAIDLITSVASYDNNEQYGPDGDYYVQLTAEWIICEDADQAFQTALWRISVTWELPEPMDWHGAVQIAEGLAFDMDSGHRPVAGILGDFSPMDSDHDLIDPILGWDGEAFEWDGLPAADAGDGA
jgi:hypothetical protein